MLVKEPELTFLKHETTNACVWLPFRDRLCTEKHGQADLRTRDPDAGILLRCYCDAAAI